MYKNHPTPKETRTNLEEKIYIKSLEYLWCQKVGSCGRLLELWQNDRIAPFKTVPLTHMNQFVHQINNRCNRFNTSKWMKKSTYAYIMQKETRIYTHWATPVIKKAIYLIGTKSRSMVIGGWNRESDRRGTKQRSRRWWRHSPSWACSGFAHAHFPKLHTLRTLNGCSLFYISYSSINSQEKKKFN